MMQLRSFNSSAAVLALLVLGGSLSGGTGCRRLAYTPTPSLSQEEAVAIITRSLEEQPGGHAAGNVDVTPEKLTFQKLHGSLVFGGKSAVPTAFYFDTLGKMDLSSRNAGSVVRVWDKFGTYRFRVVIPDPDRARLFMDAMLSMARLSPAESR